MALLIIAHEFQQACLIECTMNLQLYLFVLSRLDITIIFFQFILDQKLNSPHVNKSMLVSSDHFIVESNSTFY